MTRKDYKLIAAALLQARDTMLPTNLTGRAAIRAAVILVGQALQQDNPRFRLSTFLEASGQHL